MGHMDREGKPTQGDQMQFMSNIKIGTRVIAVLLIFTAGQIGVAWVGFNGLHVYDRSVQDMKGMSVRSVLALKINMAISDSAATARTIYAGKDARDISKQTDELLAITGGIEKLIPLYEASQPQGSQQAFQARKAMMEEFVRYRREIARLATSQGAAAAEAYGNSPEGNALRARLGKDLDDAVERNDKGIEAVMQRLHIFIEEESVLLLSLSALIILLSLSAGFGISLFTITS